MSDAVDDRDPAEVARVNQLLRANELLRAELDRLRATSADLARELLEARVGMEANRETRRAALNLMEDAVRARELSRHENEERRKVERELREAHRRKDEFLATLAHELRGPLAPVVNGLQVLQRAGGDPQVAERVHSMIERQVRHLARLVDDLMDVSRITRGKVELRRQPVALAHVVRVAVETTKPLMDAARHELEVSLPDEPCLVNADLVRLSQVLANLLGNAAKYTEPGGQISLTAEADRDTIVVSVRDNGMGIPPAMLPRIFDLFTQADRTYNSAQGGLGIGLTLVRSLVELHGGKVEARSPGPGQGSEFVVRLPRCHGEAVDSPGASAPGPLGLVRRTVLVVDDNVDSAESMAEFLHGLGAETHTAFDGPSALAAIERYTPSVVLLDIGLPGMDGFEVARLSRASGTSPAPLLIALTGWGQDEDRRQSREAGFDYHLVKPVEPRVLAELLLSLPPLGSTPA